MILLYFLKRSYIKRSIQIYTFWQYYKYLQYMRALRTNKLNFSITFKNRNLQIIHKRLHCPIPSVEFRRDCFCQNKGGNILRHWIIPNRHFGYKNKNMEWSMRAYISKTNNVPIYQSSKSSFNLLYSYIMIQSKQIPNFHNDLIS